MFKIACGGLLFGPCAAGLTPEQVCQRFTTMKGRLTQGLTNWANNNPAQHR